MRGRRHGWIVWCSFSMATYFAIRAARVCGGGALLGDLEPHPPRGLVVLGQPALPCLPGAEGEHREIVARHRDSVSTPGRISAASRRRTAAGTGRTGLAPARLRRECSAGWP